MKITQHTLSDIVDTLFNKLIDASFVNAVINQPPLFFTNTVWAKNAAYSFLPYGFEMQDKKRAKYLRKQPTSSAQWYQYNLIDDDIVQIIEQAQLSNPISIQYIFKESVNTFCLKVDAQKTGVSLTKIVVLDGIVEFSLSVDHNKHFIYNEYVYVDGKIRQILNNENGVERLFELTYVDNQLSLLSSNSNGKIKIHFEI